MAKPPHGTARQAVGVAAAQAIPTAAPVEEAAPLPVEASDIVASPVCWLRMETSLSGPTLCLNPGDLHPFDDTPGPDDLPSEAQRMIDAGFGVPCDPPVEA